MTSLSTPQDWGAALRNMAAGASITAFILLPTAPRTTALAQKQGVFCKDPLVITTIPDGLPDLGAALLRTPYGLERLDATDRAAMSMIATSSLPDATNRSLLAVELRAVSGNLPIDMLARLVHVSRMRYHEWLNGQGISDDNAARLSDLIAAFQALGSVRGLNLRTFLETPGPAGTPLSLLEQGEMATVVGLALRPVAAHPEPVTVTETARQVSGTSGWLQPARRLTWDRPHRTGEESSEARERLSPRAMAEAEDANEGEGANTPPFPLVRALFVV